MSAPRPFPAGTPVVIVESNPAAERRGYHVRQVYVAGPRHEPAPEPYGMWQELLGAPTPPGFSHALYPVNWLRSLWDQAEVER